MAHHASAKKRIRQNEKRNLRNRQALSHMKTIVKRVTVAIEAKELENIDKLFIDAQSAIAVAKRKGIIHKNNMARRISRLYKQVVAAKAAGSAE